MRVSVRRLALASLLVAAAAHAMSIRASVRLLAWSRGGGSMLVERTLRGPEGGGALGYYVLGGPPRFLVSVVLSSDLSPGGGSPDSWQKVTVVECKRRVGVLARALAARGFGPIALHAERCSARPRGRFVDVDSTLTDEVKATDLNSPDGDGRRFRRGERALDLEDSSATLRDPQLGMREMIFSLGE